TASFTPGETTKRIPVAVNGDLTFEVNETFFVNLSAPSHATIGNGKGTGTITNDDGVPSISISDVTVTEGNSGTTPAVFTVSLSNPSSQTIMVAFATADGTSHSGSDYVASNGTVVFAPGRTTKSITVQVNGDTTNEPDEIFAVNLTNPVNATISDGQ